MSELQTKARALFEAYGARSDAALQNPPREDIDGIVASFAPFFVESSPKGVIGGANDDKFRAALAPGFAHYRDVGGKHMTITNLVITELDDLHAIVHVDWDFIYRNKAGVDGHVAFRNLYFVTIASGDAKIFAYITPDEEQAMREHGLV